MKAKVLIFLMLLFSTIFWAQQFPTPPNVSQIHNQMMQHNQMMHQHQMMMRMMQNNIQTDEQKLKREGNKKIKLEKNINSLNDILLKLKDEKSKREVANIQSDEKFQKQLDKTKSEIKKNTEKLDVSNKTIEHLKNKIKKTKIELEEKKKTKE